MKEKITLIQKAIDYIEENLTEELSFDEIANFIGISSWHFQRIFRSITGDTLKEYIRGRRLALAADKLVYTKEKILDIALGAGFESPEAFTRAFYKYFAQNPKDFRESKMSKTLIPAKIKIDEKYINLLNQGEIMEPKIVTVPAKKLVGMSTSFICPFNNFKDNNFTAKPTNTERLGKIWQRFSARAGEIANRKDASTSYALYDLLPTDLDKDEEITNTYYVCYEVNDFEKIPEAMRAFYLPETKYVVFTCSLDEITNVIQYIFSSWLPKSGYTRTMGQELEIYGKDFDPANGKQMFEYCVPIK